MDLFLLRHTKSSWSEPGTHDHDRTLNERGLKSADALALHFVEHNIRPDFVICSSAERTQQTLSPILRALDATEVPVDYTPSIYEAPMSAYMDCISETADNTTLLVVGHNPTTEELAITLCREGVEGLLQHVGMGYPTGGLTHISFDETSWSDAMRNGGTFRSFVSPKTLPIL